LSVDEQDLERLVDRELKRLPLPRAPRSLAPRVMAAVAAIRPPAWYARPWLQWPIALQALSVVLFAGLAAGAWQLWNEAPQIAGRVNQMAAVSRALWNVLFGPIAIVVLGLTIVVALACAAAWTAVSRVTFGGASSP
jgi:hypothetical protein